MLRASTGAASLLTFGVSGTGFAATGAGLEAPLAIEVRLPPLNPKQSAKLCMLAAGNGSLFAGPGNKNCLLQWGHAEDNVRQPEVEGSASTCSKVQTSPLAAHTRPPVQRVAAAAARLPKVPAQL